MVYVGALAELLGIEIDEIKAALSDHFKGKPKPVELNIDMVQAAIDWARAQPHQDATLTASSAMDATGGKILIDGNTAAALGAIFGGVSVAAWYPITPSTSLADALERVPAKSCASTPRRQAPTFAVVQAEDELAAIGMVLGAGWAGARAMTATSGPGISLMTEFAGLAYFAEIPGVIWDIQRMGPSTGLPTRCRRATAQVYFLGHGDSATSCCCPARWRSASSSAGEAFDLAERLQTPVFVLSDLDLGMNIWMTEPFDYPDQPMDRGKVLTAEDLSGSAASAATRTSTATASATARCPAPSTRWRPTSRAAPATTEARSTASAPTTGRRTSTGWRKKHETARSWCPSRCGRGDGREDRHHRLRLDRPGHQEARDLLRAEGIETSYLRLRALPLDEDARATSSTRTSASMSSSMNQRRPDALSLLQAARARSTPRSIRLRSAHCDGLPLSGATSSPSAIVRTGAA